MTEREILLNYLKECTTVEDPATRKSLVDTMSMNDRKIRVIISNLQLEGHPIFSGNRGYFYARGSHKDMMAALGYITAEYKRIETLKKKILPVYNCFKKQFSKLIPALEEQPRLL